MLKIPCPQCQREIQASQESAGHTVVCLHCGAECLVPSSDATPAKGAPPPWAWAFAAVCAVIPIITVGGAIPAAIGFGGAAGCLGVARNRSMHPGARAGICSGIAFACWFAFGLLVLGVAIVQGPVAGTARASAPAMPRSSLVPQNPSPPTRTRATLRRGVDPIVERDLDPYESKSAAQEPPVVVDEEPKIYLSDLEPTSVEGVQPQRGVRGVTISGVEYEHAIWAQPSDNKGTCRISYRLDGRYSRLRGVAGMCDDTNRLPPGDPKTPAGVLRIRADGQLVWRSMNIVGAGAVETVNLDITGVQTLDLSCEGSTYAYMVRTAWATWN